MPLYNIKRSFSDKLAPFSYAIYGLNCKMPKTEICALKKICAWALPVRKKWYPFILPESKSQCLRGKKVNHQVWGSSNRPVFPLKIFIGQCFISCFKALLQLTENVSMLLWAVKLSFRDSFVSTEYLCAYLCHCITKKIL